MEEDTVALYAERVEYILAPSETGLLRKMRAFRVDDTLVIVRPTLLLERSYRELAESSDGEGLFEVVGHAPVTLNTPEDIEAFRALKAKVNKSIPIAEARGRRPDIVYSLEQAEAILRLWFETPRIPPGEVKDRAEGLLGLVEGTLSDQWCKDLCNKYIGSAKRAAPKGWDGIQVDADGKNVRYWE